MSISVIIAICVFVSILAIAFFSSFFQHRDSAKRSREQLKRYGYMKEKGETEEESPALSE